MLLSVCRLLAVYGLPLFSLRLRFLSGRKARRARYQSVIRDDHGQVAIVAPLAIGAPHRSWPYPPTVLGRSGVSVASFDLQVVNIDHDVVQLCLLLGVRASRFENLEDQPGGALVGEPQNIARLAIAATADQIHDQLRLLR